MINIDFAEFDGYLIIHIKNIDQALLNYIKTKKPIKLTKLRDKDVKIQFKSISLPEFKIQSTTSAPWSFFVWGSSEIKNKVPLIVKTQPYSSKEIKNMLKPAITSLIKEFNTQ